MCKTLELSISENYVTNWTVSDAIREILQNAIDSDKNGNDMSVEYDGDMLVISNDGVSMDESTLVLGCGTKTNDSNQIGGFSEGYKLALVVLLREGYNVLIENGNDEWLPYFEHSDAFGTSILKIDIENCCGISSGVTFKITSINEDLYEELLSDFPCINQDFGEVIEAPFGKILMDERFKGKMFVEGLYVQDDSNYEYGYDFNAREVSLDRDRKAINYYELRELVAKTLISAQSCDERIYKSIVKGRNSDIDDIVDVLEHSSKTFLDEFKERYMEDKNIDEDTIVGTESICLELEKHGYKSYEDTEMVSKLFAKAINKESILDEIEERLESKSTNEKAWSNFEESYFRKLLIFMESIKNISEDKYSELYNLLVDVVPSCLTPSHYVYIKKDILNNLPDSLTDEYIEDKKLELE